MEAHVPTDSSFSSCRLRESRALGKLVQTMFILCVLVTCVSALTTSSVAHAEQVSESPTTPEKRTGKKQPVQQEKSRTQHFWGGTFLQTNIHIQDMANLLLFKETFVMESETPGKRPQA